MPEQGASQAALMFLAWTRGFDMVNGRHCFVLYTKAIDDMTAITNRKGNSVYQFDQDAMRVHAIEWRRGYRTYLFVE